MKYFFQLFDYEVSKFGKVKLKKNPEKKGRRIEEKEKSSRNIIGDVNSLFCSATYQMFIKKEEKVEEGLKFRREEKKLMKRLYILSYSPRSVERLAANFRELAGRNKEILAAS